jgi:hypothetical protein
VPLLLAGCLPGGGISPDDTDAVSRYERVFFFFFFTDKNSLLAFIMGNKHCVNMHLIL